MRIDPTTGLEPRSVTDAKNPAAAVRRAAEQIAADAALPAVPMAHEPYVAAAQAAQDVDTSAVEAARKALESGELDTPQSIANLAQKLVKLGL